MTAPVSIVLPSLGTRELLEANLPPLLEELTRRDAGDEVLVVDDTGDDVLSAWLAERFPTVVVVAREENGGFARAMTTGIERAEHELVFSMNTDVRVRPGFLEPLIEVLTPETFAAVPRVLLNGEEERIESWTGLELREGFAEVVQLALDESSATPPETSAPVAFAVGGTFLFRRAEFLEMGGFDPLFDPFYWEDVDLCWRAWRGGQRTVYQPASVVEHHHRGTIGELVPRGLVRAAIEKNRLLFQWKNLDEPQLFAEHVSALYRWLVDAWLTDAHDELVWLNLALEEAERAWAGRPGGEGPDFGQILAGLRGRPPKP